jgi:hypothetical protein
MTNEFGRIHPFPYLGYFDGIFELDHCQFHPFGPNILIFHHNHFKATNFSNNLLAIRNKHFGSSLVKSIQEH